MNRYFALLILSLLIIGNISAQEIDTIINYGDTLETSAISDTSYFTIGEKKIEIIEKNDSTYVKVWNEQEEAKIEKSDDESEGDDSDFFWEDNFKDRHRFRGHWAGFEFGMNNYVDNNFSLSRTSENEFMDLNTNRSWNFNLNFAQFSLPFNSQYIGMVTGMGIEWSNYHFSTTNTIIKDPQTQQIEPLELNYDLILNRFQTTYLTIPLLIELQFFNAPRRQRMYIATGIIGGLKLGAHTKYTYTDNGVKRKEKHKSDYYLRPFRYAFTGRVGYKLIKVYMNYYPTSLFLDDKGPELYPIAMGFCITF